MKSILRIVTLLAMVTTMFVVFVIEWGWWGLLVGVGCLLGVVLLVWLAEE